MYTARLPIQILDDLGRLLSDNGKLRARLIDELAQNANATYPIIRDRLPLYGVDAEKIEQVIKDIEKARKPK